MAGQPPTVAVIGASRGLGLEFVRSYAAEGARVHAFCRDPKPGTGLAGIGGDVRAHSLDLRRPGDAIAAAKTCGEPIDLYLHGAAIYGPDDAELDAESWAEVLQVNVIGAILCARAFRPLVAAGAGRRMVFLTSRMGSIGDNRSGGATAYRSSKAALNAAVRSLAIELAGEGIAAIVMHPGWVRTAMGGASAPLTVAASVLDMRRLIDRFGAAESGRFWNRDGTELPW